jgi:hypothetical protein
MGLMPSMSARSPVMQDLEAVPLSRQMCRLRRATVANELLKSRFIS